MPAFGSAKRADSRYVRFFEADSEVELVGFGAHAYAVSQHSRTSSDDFGDSRYNDWHGLQKDDDHPDIIRNLMCSILFRNLHVWGFCDRPTRREIVEEFVSLFQTFKDRGAEQRDSAALRERCLLEAGLLQPILKGLAERTQTETGKK